MKTCSKFNFLQCSIIIFFLLFTKPLKPNTVHHLCIRMSDEHIYTKFEIKLRYSAQIRKYKPLLHCTESLKQEDNEPFFIDGR